MSNVTTSSATTTIVNVLINVFRVVMISMDALVVMIAIQSFLNIQRRLHTVCTIWCFSIALMRGTMNS